MIPSLKCSPLLGGESISTLCTTVHPIPGPVTSGKAWFTTLEMKHVTWPKLNRSFHPLSTVSNVALGMWSHQNSSQTQSFGLTVGVNEGFLFLLDLNLGGCRAGPMQPPWHHEGEGLSENWGKTIEVDPRDGEETAVLDDVVWGAALRLDFSFIWVKISLSQKAGLSCVLCPSLNKSHTDANGR